MLFVVARMLVLCVNNLCRPTGVLPAVPPIPKAPGTLLPAFESPQSLHPDSDVEDKIPCNHHSDADEASERLESVFLCVFTRGLSQKLLALYRKKHNRATIAIFFYVIPVNFSALIPLFLQLRYSIVVEEFMLPLKKVLHRL